MWNKRNAPVSRRCQSGGKMRKMNTMFHRIALLVALAFAVQAGPITWNLNDAVFGDGGTAVGSFVYDASITTVVSYSIQTSAVSNPAFPGFLYQNGAPNNLGAMVIPVPYYILFETSFTNGNLNGIELRLAPVAGLTDAGGVVSLDLSSLSVECYNCSPFRLFVSGELVSAGVPEPATGLLVLVPLAWGVLVRRRISGRR
jgi:hypothetical protein